MSAVGKVFHNVRGFRTAIQDVGRLRQIVMVLARHGFGWVVSRLNLGEVIGRQPVAVESASVPALSRGRRLRMALEELGPTFIKLGQLLSTRYDLVPTDIVEELQLLQDDLPPMPAEEVDAQLRNELGAPAEELFADFDTKPLACASVAQVHRAVLHDGDQVVVKVRRRRIRRTIESDLSILKFLAARMAAAVPELGLIEPVGIVQEFERALTKELDFTHERQHIKRFRTHFSDFEGVTAPALVAHLCTAAVLTMEYVEGVKITLAPHVHAIEPHALASRMLRALFKMVFEDGYFHGDLHPGNIIVRSNGDIVLIDFGLVGRLLPSQRDRILDLLIGLSREDYELVAQVMFELGVKVPGVQYDFDAFEADVIEVMDRHITGQTLANVDLQAFFSDLMGGAIRHNIKMPPTYTMVFKALMTIEGIGKTLAPDLDVLAEARPFVQELSLDRYNPVRLAKEAGHSLSSANKLLRTASRSLPGLMREMEQGRMGVRIQSEQLEQMLEQQRRGARATMRATLFAASLLAGTLALDAPGPSVLGIHVVSFGAYLLAVASGIPLIASLLRL